ncbi:hypothetical protein BMETH_69_2 [methanotrophic bacterial endosymbiont of Bathymodiolus sp.]|nr:hypothetical protein BMETH_69_2 [methanotrophic bacterial endosymbiont of Bathymodiolus sp.]
MIIEKTFKRLAGYGISLLLESLRKASPNRFITDYRAIRKIPFAGIINKRAIIPEQKNDINNA